MTLEGLASSIRYVPGIAKAADGGAGLRLTFRGLRPPDVAYTAIIIQCAFCDTPGTIFLAYADKQNWVPS
jgi:hypothetical protein